MRVEATKDFGLRECPACACEVPRNSNRCPVCGYEFPYLPVNSRARWWGALAMLLLLALLLLWGRLF